DGQPHAVNLATFGRDVGHYRHRHFFEVHDGNHRALICFAGLGYNHSNTLIKTPIVFEPTPPEPIEILASYIFHRTEEIIRRRVFIRPAVQIGFESTIEPFGPEYFITEQRKA